MPKKTAVEELIEWWESMDIDEEDFWNAKETIEELRQAIEEDKCKK